MERDFDLFKVDKAPCDKNLVTALGCDAGNLVPKLVTPKKPLFYKAISYICDKSDKIIN